MKFSSFSHQAKIGAAKLVSWELSKVPPEKQPSGVQPAYGVNLNLCVAQQSSVCLEYPDQLNY